MRFPIPFLLLFCYLCPMSMVFAQDRAIAVSQHTLLGMKMDSSASSDILYNPDPRAAWFPQAGLGLFIHWGAIAGYGGGDLSWCMLANKSWADGTVTPNYYYNLLKNWRPDKFNADELIRKARDAGFKYAVMVTKHHDGYTLWPSKSGDLGTQTMLNGADFVKPFIEACRKYGLKVGLYYSPPDWWFDRTYRNWSYNDSVFLDMDHKKISRREIPPSHNTARRDMVAAQVRELLKNYGKIDLLWFDGGQAEISNAEVRKLQPGIVINRRNGEKGDYGDSEGARPTKRFKGWFETCDPVWPDRWWSYSTSDTYADACAVIRELVYLRAWGGNLLANIGPLADGSIPEAATIAMADMAVWMKHSGESVYGTFGGNYPEQANVPNTVKEKTVYAFLMPEIAGGAFISVHKKPVRAVLLRTGDSVDYRVENGQLRFTIPPSLRSRLPDVVKFEF